MSTLHYYSLTCPKKNLLRHGQPCAGPTVGRCLPCACGHYWCVKGALTMMGAFVGRRVEQHHAAAFVSVSHATAAGNAVDAAPDHRVVPNFLPSEHHPLDESEPWLALLPEEPFFLYVGDLRLAKGFDVLLAAYRQLGSARPLVVIGKRWPEFERAFVPDLRDGLARVGRGEEIRGFEARYLRRDGNAIDIAAWAAPIVKLPP